MQLVVGGNGFIGRHLVEMLRMAGEDVRSFDITSRPAFAPDGVEYVEGNLSDGAAIRAAVRGCEVVFHLACTTVPQTSNDNAVEDIKTNVMGTLTLLDACVASRV